MLLCTITLYGILEQWPKECLEEILHQCEPLAFPELGLKSNLFANIATVSSPSHTTCSYMREHIQTSDRILATSAEKLSGDKTTSETTGKHHNVYSYKVTL